MAGLRRRSCISKLVSSLLRTLRLLMNLSPRTGSQISLSQCSRSHVRRCAVDQLLLQGNGLTDCIGCNDCCCSEANRAPSNSYRRRACLHELGKDKTHPVAALFRLIIYFKGGSLSPWIGTGVTRHSRRVPLLNRKRLSHSSDHPFSIDLVAGRPGVRPRKFCV